MTDTLLEKMDHIEKMLMELNAKIDNFLGYEEISDSEKKEINEIRDEVKRGEYVRFEDLFGGS